MNHNARQHGFTLLELIVAIAMIGILLGVAAGTIRWDRFALQQAAQAIQSEVRDTRIEAIRRNQTVGIEFQSNNQQYVVYIDTDGTRNLSNPDTIITRNGMGADPFRGVRIGSITSNGYPASAINVVFDARGIPRSGSAGSVRLSNPAGNASVDLVISLQGRVAVQ